jgi:hypothetical protein
MSEPKRRRKVGALISEIPIPSYAHQPRGIGPRVLCRKPVGAVVPITHAPQVPWPFYRVQQSSGGQNE